ncbi:DNA-binding protein [Faecalicoccus pleomorphus]|uniref:DNA-binding protein n=1 Tax=Faecalicoccus pleomorphus TaxID=1323 RepID=UPI002431DA31|nr:DNA-binding protein [Faecalicoccus pleomorphus]
MGYLSIRQTSEKWNLSARWINDLCIEGRIPCAMKIGSYWAIPEEAEKPKDARIRSGKYIKVRV